MGYDYSTLYPASRYVVVLYERPRSVFQPIIYATDGSVGMGLFSVSSIQSIVFWVASVIIWVLGIISIFKPVYRQNIFFIIAVVSIVQIAFIEGCRIWLYNSVPTRFDYM